MNKSAFLITLLCFHCTLSFAADGLISKTSKYSVHETMNRYEKIVKKKGFNVIARVNHSASAKESGKQLLPTELLIFGNPKLGTLLMQSNQTIGIDLPIKVLIWENKEGAVTLSYNDPSWLKKRHGISNKDSAFEKMAGALNAFSSAAVK